jgi:putative hydrolase of the HAD superfamily
VTPRALLFDLDDTLYRERRFMLSGYAAVAGAVAARTSAPARAVLRRLARAATSGGRGRAFQDVCRHYGLEQSVVPELVAIYRGHRPSLRLPRASRRVLEMVRQRWRTAVITNGPPDVQKRKLEALGLPPLVDVVVLAHACGARLGKPDAEPFLHALAQLGVLPSAAVMVGDDPLADIDGARCLGIRAIQVRRAPGAPVHAHADAVVDSIDHVPALAERLLQEQVVHAD